MNLGWSLKSTTSPLALPRYPRNTKVILKCKEYSLEGVLLPSSPVSSLVSAALWACRIQMLETRRSRYRHFVLQYLLIVGHSASDCYSVHRECLSFSLAASWTLGVPTNDPFLRLRGLLSFSLGRRLNKGEGRLREHSSNMLKNMET